MLDVLRHGDYDDYWKQHGYNVEEYYEEHADVPIYLLSGWYDSYTRATTDNYVALTERKQGPVRHDHRPVDARRRRRSTQT